MTGLELVLIVGATMRVTRLLQADSILDEPRRWLQSKLRGRKVGELLWCPWCLSIWTGALVVASWDRWGHTTDWWSPVAALFTASMVTGVYSVWEDR